jgi:hypothetical protein
MIAPPPKRSQQPAFRWTLAQPAAIGVCALLGAFSGWLFSRDNLPFAWIMFLFGFVWVLIISLLLGLILAYRVRLVRADWRAALHIGLASAFPTATAYLALMALLTWPIKLALIELPTGGQALSRPDLLRHAPVLYLCSLVVGLISGPLYAAASPLQPQRILPIGVEAAEAETAVECKAS